MFLVSELGMGREGGGHEEGGMICAVGTHVAGVTTGVDGIQPVMAVTTRGFL